MGKQEQHGAYCGFCTFAEFVESGSAYPGIFIGWVSQDIIRAGKCFASLIRLELTKFFCFQGAKDSLFDLAKVEVETFGHEVEEDFHVYEKPQFRALIKSKTLDHVTYRIEVECFDLGDNIIAKAELVIHQNPK